MEQFVKQEDHIRYVILKKASVLESFNTRSLIEEVSREQGWSKDEVARVMGTLMADGAIDFKK